jgi:hypothetical protein
MAIKESLEQLVVEHASSAIPHCKMGVRML